MVSSRTETTPGARGRPRPARGQRQASRHDASAGGAAGPASARGPAWASEATGPAWVAGTAGAAMTAAAGGRAGRGIRADRGTRTGSRIGSVRQPASSGTARAKQAVPPRTVPSRTVPSRTVPSRTVPPRTVPSRTRQGKGRGAVGLPRMPFVLLVLGLLGGGLICLLVINTTLGAASFRIAQLQDTNNSLSEQQQTLQLQIATDESQAEIARRAYDLGMRSQSQLSFLDLASGRIYQAGVRGPGLVEQPAPGARGKPGTTPRTGTGSKTGTAAGHARHVRHVRSGKRPGAGRPGARRTGARRTGTGGKSKTRRGR